MSVSCSIEQEMDHDLVCSCNFPLSFSLAPLCPIVFAKGISFFFFFFNANFHWLVLFKPTQLLQEKGTYRKNQNNLTVLVIRLSGFCTFSYLIHQVLCTVKYKDTVTSKGQIVLFHNDRHIGGMKDPLHLVLSLLAIDEV